MGVSELEGMLMVSLVRMEEMMSVVKTMSMSSNSAQLLIRSLPFVVGVWLRGRSATVLGAFKVCSVPKQFNHWGWVGYIIEF